VIKTISEEGVIKLVPESTNDSFRLGMLVCGLNNPGTKYTVSSSPDSPKGELEFVELSLDSLLDYVHRSI